MGNETSTQELKKAIGTLKVAMDFAAQSSTIEAQFKIARDACIQRFEYCIELSWKIAMKKLGSQTKFAKPAIREMARGNLIQSAEAWLEFIDARNDSSHSYNEETAAAVFQQIQLFLPEAELLLEGLEKIE